MGDAKILNFIPSFMFHLQKAITTFYMEKSRKEK